MVTLTAQAFNVFTIVTFAIITLILALQNALGSTWTNATGNGLWIDERNWSDGVPTDSAELPTPIPMSDPVIRVTSDFSGGAIIARDEYKVVVESGRFRVGAYGNAVSFIAPSTDAVFTIQIDANAALETRLGDDLHGDAGTGEVSSGLIHLTGDGLTDDVPMAVIKSMVPSFKIMFELSRLTPPLSTPPPLISTAAFSTTRFVSNSGPKIVA